MESPEGEDRESPKIYLKKLWLKMSHTQKKESDIPIQETQRVPNKRTQTDSHDIIIKPSLN